MDPITVNGSPDTPATPATPAAAAVDNSAELAALRAEIAENKRATEFWYGKATAAAAAPPPAAEPEPELEDVDLLDLISTGGTKAFDKYMKGRGYMSKAEVDLVVNTKANQLSAEADLIGAYPDLRKPDSPFFQATAAAYGELKRQGVPEALAMKLAAERAELQGFKSGKTKLVDPNDKEAARLARVKAQSGDKSARAAATADPDDDDEITDQERHICEAMGITVEAYQKRAKGGVAMGLKQMPAGKK